MVDVYNAMNPAIARAARKAASIASTVQAYRLPCLGVSAPSYEEDATVDLFKAGDRYLSISVHLDGSLSLTYSDDGKLITFNPETRSIAAVLQQAQEVLPRLVAAAAAANPFTVGLPVLARFRDDGAWYPGTISRVLKRSYDVAWADGSGVSRVDEVKLPPKRGGRRASH